MNWLQRAKARYWLLTRMEQVNQWQATIIQARENEVRQLKLAGLAMQQAQRDLIAAWRVSLEKPEIDIRDDLDELLRDISDQVSVLEEQIVA